MIRLLAACLLATLAACSTEEDIQRFQIEAAPSEVRHRIAADTIEVRLVSLPLYVDTEEIPRLAPDGSVRATADVLWADQPDRALSQVLSRNLAEITGAATAVEPWPLEASPELRVEIRVDEMVAPLGGILRFGGAWFASEPGNPDGDRSGRFLISEVTGGDDYRSLSRAYARATRRLAEGIAVRLR